MRWQRGTWEDVLPGDQVISPQGAPRVVGVMAEYAEDEFYVELGRPRIFGIFTQTNCQRGTVKEWQDVIYRPTSKFRPVDETSDFPIRLELPINPDHRRSAWAQHLQHFYPKYEELSDANLEMKVAARLGLLRPKEGKK